MNLVKSYDFFNPQLVDGSIHIIGCGSVGSEIADMLARFGVENFVLYDFDVVESKNIVNQRFTEEDIGMLKTEALERIIKRINPSANVKRYDDGWNGQRLSGYVFLAVDNIDLRREICEKNVNNRVIKAMFDFRTRLTDGQHYAADWSSREDIDNMIASMQFTHEEAKEATPTTACGTELGVKPTVNAVVIAGICNFIHFCKKEDMKKIIVVNPFNNIIF